MRNVRMTGIGPRSKPAAKTGTRKSARMTTIGATSDLVKETGAKKDRMPTIGTRGGPVAQTGTRNIQRTAVGSRRAQTAKVGTKQMRIAENKQSPRHLMKNRAAKNRRAKARAEKPNPENVLWSRKPYRKKFLFRRECRQMISLNLLLIMPICWML